MNIKDIAFSLVPVSDLKVSRAFYENVLSLKPTSVFEKDGMGMIEYDIGAATLAIGAGAPFFKPSKEGGTVAFEVEDFTAAVERLKSANVPFVMDAYETPVCHMAIIRDPDGSQLMIHQRKRS